MKDIEMLSRARMQGSGDHALLSKRIKHGQERLRKKMLDINVKSIGISDYNQRYLLEKIHSIDIALDTYGRILKFALSKQPVMPEGLTLVDYGGGSGLLSLLAKEIGVGSVIYDDIYDVSCADVGHVSRILGLPLDHIVCGNIDELCSYLKLNSLSINAIASYDVLEHIYDIEYHFRRLRSLPDGKFRVIYASGANTENPLIVRGVTRKQIDAEHKNRDKKWGYKERDSLNAYYDIRKEIVTTYAPELPSEQIEHLSWLTRGLIRSDIENCVDEYRQRGRISYSPGHPTNTCDPSTGNWCEHLMEYRWLEIVVRNAGFSTNILPGVYALSGSLTKRTAKALLNLAIRFLGRRGMFIAPYFVLYADCLSE